ncbi:MAG: hypothetical protein D6765_03420, partial [Bacteroidetes bacterium]
PEFEQVPPEERDEVQEQIAEAFAWRFFRVCDSGRFETLSEEEATQTMAKALTPERQQQACEENRARYGKLEALRLVEVARPKGGSALRIFRFRGDFTNSVEQPEIRVVLDGRNRLAGIWLRPWNEKM